ncbi:hypothetical protein WKT12_04635 [Phocaeicola sp. HCN-6420]
MHRKCYICIEERLPMRLWEQAPRQKYDVRHLPSFGDNKLIHSAFERWEGEKGVSIHLQEITRRKPKTTIY